MKTELIAGYSPVTYEGTQYFVVTTITGVVIWVFANRFDTSSQTISYESHKAGDKYTDKDGVEGTFSKDGNRFKCSGKQTVVQLIEVLLSKGIQPTLLNT